MVRPAEPHEYGVIGRLTVEAYEEYRPSIPERFWASYQAELADVDSRAERGDVLVAIGADGRVVGSASLVPSRKRHDVLYLRYLAVSPSSRGRGIGRALMDAVVEHAREAGAGALEWQTAEFMRSARALYEHLGYEGRPEASDVARHITVYWYRLELD